MKKLGLESEQNSNDVITVPWIRDDPQYEIKGDLPPEYYSHFGNKAPLSWKPSQENPFYGYEWLFKPVSAMIGDGSNL